MSDSQPLYLLLTITFLAFITSLFLPVSGYYRLALFTTTSLPVVYTARYFGRSVVKEEEFQYYRLSSKVKILEKDFVAILTAFTIGYIVYVATSRDMSTAGLILYTIAFVIIIILKHVIQLWLKAGSAIVDVDNPFVALVASFAFALLGFAVECAIFSLIS